MTTMYPQHHALLFIGEASFDEPSFRSVYGKTHDIISQSFAEFRINDARQLISLATTTPAHHPKQCFIIHAQTIAIEAQNALLKLLEEPPAVSSFVFVLPHTVLVPTLRSRFMIIEDTRTAAEITVTFLDFLGGSVPDRLAQISTLFDKKDPVAFVLLRGDLVQYVSEHRRVFPSATLTRLHWLLTQMELRGSSTKMLWEEVAFTLPVEVR